MAAGLLLGMTAASSAWAEAAAVSDDPAGETPAVSVGLVAAESDFGNTQTGQGPAVGADSAAPGSVDAAPADGNPASGNTVVLPVNSGKKSTGYACGGWAVPPDRS